MKQINVKPKANSYTIYIGSKINIVNIIQKINRELSLGNKAILITNFTLRHLHRDALNKLAVLRPEVIALPDSERIKSFRYCMKLIKVISKFDYKNKIFLIGWGGGVIGDLTGFTAAIYRRGISYIQVPTTLLAQVDASMGGKTAVDIEKGKNLVGTFWQPRSVIIDTTLLNTLPVHQIKEGLSEVLKYALISQKSLLRYLETNHAKVFAKSTKTMEKIVYECARIKAGIVTKDEKEDLGIRTILNFGHTFAHAIEAASSYKISHGKAVALGIIAALRLSELETGLNPEITKRIQALMEKLKLPLRLKRDRKFWKRVEKHMRFDKKFIHNTTRFVLLEALEKPVIKEKISISAIRRSLEFIKP